MKAIQITKHESPGDGVQPVVEAGDDRTAGGARYAYVVRGGGQITHLVFPNPKPGDALMVAGLTNEALLAVVLDRLECFQQGPHPCGENQKAGQYIEAALRCLQDRTRRVAKQRTPEAPGAPGAPEAPGAAAAGEPVPQVTRVDGWEDE